MPTSSTKLDHQAASLRSLLGADLVIYWQKESTALAVTRGVSPATVLTGYFLPPVQSCSDELIEGEEALKALPLQVRARMNLATATAMIGCAHQDTESDVGIMAIWFSAPHMPDTMLRHSFRFALAALNVQHQLAGARQEAWRRSERQIFSLAKALPQGAIIVPSGNAPGYVNAKAASYLGLTPGKVDAARLAQALTDFARRATNADELRNQLNIFVNDGGHDPLSGLIWWFKDIPMALRVTLAPIDPDGQKGWLWLLEDITKDKAASEEMQRMAFYDPLTQLPNRRLMHEHLSKAMARSIRSMKHGALVILDLDKFKTLNDTRGHDAGDQLLIDVSRRLQSLVRENDLVVRLGGDEFVVIFEDLSADDLEAATQAKHVAELIRAALEIPFQLTDGEFQTSASIGIALFLGQEKTPDTLFKQSDTAMYQAKNAGRNALCLFQE